MSIFAQIYTDEDVAGLVTTLLKSRGISATSSPEQRQLGQSDEEQLAFAVAIGHCILTHNRVDFETLHLQYTDSGRSHAGIMIAPRKLPTKLCSGQ
jgi:hypothetical protein